MVDRDRGTGGFHHENGCLMQCHAATHLTRLHRRGSRGVQPSRWLTMPRDTTHLSSPNRYRRGHRGAPRPSRHQSAMRPAAQRTLHQRHAGRATILPALLISTPTLSPCRRALSRGGSPESRCASQDTPWHSQPQPTQFRTAAYPAGAFSAAVTARRWRTTSASLLATSGPRTRPSRAQLPMRPPRSRTPTTIFNRASR